MSATGALLWNPDGRLEHHAQQRQQLLSPLCIPSSGPSEGLPLFQRIRGRVFLREECGNTASWLCEGVYLCVGVNKVNPYTMWPFIWLKTTDWTLAEHRAKFNWRHWRCVMWQGATSWSKSFSTFHRLRIAWIQCWRILNNKKQVNVNLNYSNI